MQPKQLTGMEVMLSTNVSHLMPPMSEIPREFQNNLWSKLVSDWFFLGLDSGKLKEKTGIDRSTAIRHLKAIMGSFDPAHEHKIAAVAYLMSQWFDITEPALKPEPKRMERTYSPKPISPKGKTKPNKSNKIQAWLTR